ncbi:Unknown protein, partial [Striga hermonthica]
VQNPLPYHARPARSSRPSPTAPCIPPTPAACSPTTHPRAPSAAPRSTHAQGAPSLQDRVHHAHERCPNREQPEDQRREEREQRQADFEQDDDFDQRSQASNDYDRPKPVKPQLTLSTFNGTDPDAWLNRAVQYFELNEINGHDRVRYAAYYLDGEANVWWQWLVSIYQGNPLHIRWAEFECELLARFGSSDYHSYDESLSHIKQTGSLRGYMKEFERLACRVRNWTSSALIGTFIGWLKFELAAEVRLDQPHTLREAMESARRRDEHLMATRRIGRESVRNMEQRRMDQHLNERTIIDNAPSNMSNVQPNPRPPNNFRTPPPSVKQLTFEEMRRRREKGLCYKCEERFTSGHQCERLFLIDVIEEDEKEAYEEQPAQQVNEVLEISVNAMAGLQGPRTIQLPAMIKKRPIEVLVDTGSSHNFICDRIRKDLVLKATKVEPFDVRVANGERLRCHEYYRE